jgi:hypothetical protein
MAIGIILSPVIAAGEKEGALEAPGLLTVASPGKDYHWKFVTSKEMNGVKADFFLCTNARSTSRMVLIAERRKADTEAKRSAAVKAQWNTLAALQEQGFRDLAGKRPSLVAPIPDKVYFSMSGKGPDGNPVFIRCAVVFGKNTYAFQALAGTAAESDRLIAVVKTLKESK